MSWLAWTGIALVMVFIIYFMFFYGRKKKMSRPVSRVQPPPYQGYDRRQNVARPTVGRLDDDDPEEAESYIRRRRRLRAEDMMQDSAVDDTLIAAGLLSTMNSEDHHVEPARSHYADTVTPEPSPAPSTDIGGSSNFETGGGFGGEPSSFDTGGGFGGDSGFSSGSDGGGGGGSND